jgi:hypothetical protein
LCFFIESSLGYYGYNCNELYDGCLSDACDSEFGICINTSGCNPGWQSGNNKYDLGIVESNKVLIEYISSLHTNLWGEKQHMLTV